MSFVVLAFVFVSPLSAGARFNLPAFWLPPAASRVPLFLQSSLFFPSIPLSCYRPDSLPVSNFDLSCSGEHLFPLSFFLRRSLMRPLQSILPLHGADVFSFFFVLPSSSRCLGGLRCFWLPRGRIATGCLPYSAPTCPALRFFGVCRRICFRFLARATSRPLFLFLCFSRLSRFSARSCSLPLPSLLVPRPSPNMASLRGLFACMCLARLWPGCLFVCQLGPAVVCSGPLVRIPMLRFSPAWHVLLHLPALPVCCCYLVDCRLFLPFAAFSRFRFALVSALLRAPALACFPVLLVRYPFFLRPSHAFILSVLSSRRCKPLRAPPHDFLSFLSASPSSPLLWCAACLPSCLAGAHVAGPSLFVSRTLRRSSSLSASIRSFFTLLKCRPPSPAHLRAGSHFSPPDFFISSFPFIDVCFP